ncbi:cardiac phospholamban [Rhineura floridana]|uniref:cardiac phospholamban n=1 Tax=Rhineura floridana TaxID=261503 RepID=UPI002AC7FBFE|nr:cardiac phospholamban [Rhineura floridana]
MLSSTKTLKTKQRRYQTLFTVLENHCFLKICSIFLKFYFPVAMEKVQYITRSAIRRASTIEVNPQTRQRLQELFVNFCLILICLLLICIIVMLL